MCTPFPPKKKHAGQPHAAQSCAPGHLHFSFCFVAAFETARQLFEYMRQLFGPWGAFLFSARQAEDISDEEKNLHHRPAAQPIKQTGLLKLTSLPFMTKSSSASWGFGLRALRSSTLHTAPHPIHTYVAPLGGKGAARWLLKSPPFFFGMVDHSLSLHSLWCSVVLQPVQSFLGAYVVKWSQVLFLTVRLSCHFERPPFGFIAKQLSALSIWFVHRFHTCSFLC